MSKTKTVYAYFHHKEYELPLDAVEDICQQGANDEAVEYWSNKIDLGISRKDLISGLKECGAWSKEELSALSDDELSKKALWLMAWDAHDNLREKESES